MYGLCQDRDGDQNRLPSVAGVFHIRKVVTVASVPDVRQDFSAKINGYVIV